MDQNAIQRYAKLIVSVAKQKPSKLVMSLSKGLTEIDPIAQALCSDIVGEAKTNNKQAAIKKIGDTMAQCNILSTDKENENIFEEIQQLI